jgi:nucleoid-associated protein YgaU
MAKAKKKNKLTQTKSLVEKAEALIKNKPKEFMIGFLSLSVMLVFFVYLSVYFYTQQPSQQPAVTVTEEPEKEPEESAAYYILKEGESLSDVASQEYGDGQLYPTIVELNNFSNPDLVEPGTRIRVK